MESQGYELPSQIEAYISTLFRMYARDGQERLQRILVSGEVSIEECVTYDNWDGGISGHAIKLSLPEEMYFEILDDKEDIQKQLTSDLNRLHDVSGEYIAQVLLKVNPSYKEGWRQEAGGLVAHRTAPTVPPSALERIWGPGQVRVFLSHKANVKVQTSKLKDALARCGLAGFVAHEDIEPNEDWQHEIQNALFSADALVALLTADFHDSPWTDQEVGIALGRSMPVISVRLPTDPYGFMGSKQGLSGCRLDRPDDMAAKIFAVLCKRLSDQDLMFRCALDAYERSTSWEDSGWKVKHLLSCFDELSIEQVERVLHAYRSNPKNRSSFKGMDHLQPLLKKWTGQSWVVRNNELVVERGVTETMEDIPF